MKPRWKSLWITSAASGCGRGRVSSASPKHAMPPARIWLAPCPSGLGASSDLERLDGVELRLDLVLFDVQVVLILQIEPELGGGAEVLAQAQGRVGSDRALAMHDLVDPARRHANADCKPVLGDLEPLDEVLHQHLAGMDG